ncbi:hypothetical protein RhiirA5_495506 [Rhizophagus irregularis]|uniref:Uncharacterized protein n=1 Tax=Rhizophagus irregularis TaxID=588596 RepID=A0A2N0Q5D3_9GLOM|nr:hypothetical protein RhiirA5_495506 [Rhizophagus irregularis]
MNNQLLHFLLIFRYEQITFISNIRRNMEMECWIYINNLKNTRTIEYRKEEINGESNDINNLKSFLDIIIEKDIQEIKISCKKECEKSLKSLRNLSKKKSEQIKCEYFKNDSSKDNNGLVITDKSEETEEAISTDRSSLGVTNINLRLDGKNKSFLKTIENG